MAHNCVKKSLKRGINDCHLLTDEVEDCIAFKFAIISCKVVVVVSHLFSCCVEVCPSENNQNVSYRHCNYAPHWFGANFVCLDLFAPDSYGFERDFIVLTASPTLLASLASFSRFGRSSPNRNLL